MTAARSLQAADVASSHAPCRSVFRREAEAVGVSGSRIHFTRGYSEEEHLTIKVRGEG